MLILLIVLLIFTLYPTYRIKIKKTTRNKQNKLKNIHKNKSAKSITNGIIWLCQKISKCKQNEACVLLYKRGVI